MTLRRHRAWAVGLLAGALALAACDEGSTPASDPPETRDGGAPETEGPTDTGVTDSGEGDAGASDARPDGAEPDAEPVDATTADATAADATAADATAADGGPIAADCWWPAVAQLAAEPIEDETGRATVELDGDPCQRRFTLSTTAELRDGVPDNPRVIEEQADGLALRTGDVMFDALYTLAIEEAGENAVSAIRDGAFRDGAPVDCPPGGCYETGRLWTYVWTRDTAYSVDLALAGVDPLRSVNSLRFKLSAPRGGGDPVIVQDTGTGGSWPVSTDRVVWAIGARAALGWLDEAARVDFAADAHAALQGTLEADRAVAFDATTGLYRGEQSFLDWREQSYPRWVVPDLAHIAMSRSLSTNVGHLAAIALFADLAEERGAGATARGWRRRASDLRQAIRDRLLLPSGDLSTFMPTTLDGAAAEQLDLLGLSLAILEGVLSPDEARQALSRYPVFAAGPPVIWPQQQFTRIYHNRGIWPFVTAYFVRAATRVAHPAAIDFGVESLVRGAALNLSNMENFEASTGRPFLADGDFSGPVVNSQRQLWSVAGYVAMVHDVLFGLRAGPPGQLGPHLVLAPAITRSLREGRFAASDGVLLAGVRWQGHVLDVMVRLPPVGEGSGADYAIDAIHVDGIALADAIVEDATRPFGRLMLDMLPPPGEAPTRVEVFLMPRASAPGTLTRVADPGSWRAVFAPRFPRITGVERVRDGVALSLEGGGDEPGDITWEILRDGVLLATDLPGETARWVDTEGPFDRPRCYTARVRFRQPVAPGRAGNASHHAAPNCWWGPGGGRVTIVPAADLRVFEGERADEHGRPHVRDPGGAGIALDFTPAHDGLHWIQAVYGNGAGSLSSGITCGVRRVSVAELDGGAVIGVGHLAMPQLGDWARWSESTLAPIDLEAGRRYRITISGQGEHASNMSSLEHFVDYTAGLGGQDGAFNAINVAEVRLLAWPGAD